MEYRQRVVNALVNEIVDGIIKILEEHGEVSIRKIIAELGITNYKIMQILCVLSALGVVSITSSRNKLLVRLDDVSKVEKAKRIFKERLSFIFIL